jgi:hypothetical protein
MHKNAMKCNETLSKWCKNKHGASKIIDTFETYQSSRLKVYTNIKLQDSTSRIEASISIHEGSDNPKTTKATREASTL